MFIQEMDDHDKVWVFTLIGNGRLVGQMVSYVVDSMGHPIMIQIREGAADAALTDIPWSAIMHIRSLYDRYTPKVR